MADKAKIQRLQTGVKHLDAILDGGLPLGSVNIIGGPPGSGKTILSQQIAFHHAVQGGKSLCIQTLSEPTVKTLRYLRQFSYFDNTKMHKNVMFVDLGAILKTKGLEPTLEMIITQIKEEKPSLVVIDSVRVFDDLAGSNEELRKFSYLLGINMIAWECTALLLGEFGLKDFETNPLFSIVDGFLMMTQEEVSGEQQRFLQVIKLRGAAHNRDKHFFRISDDGIMVCSSKGLLRRDPRVELANRDKAKLKTGIGALDNLLNSGIKRGSSILVSGHSGTGKTLLLLEFIYRGATEFGEKGLLITFDETSESLLATAREMGWDFQREVDRGLIEVLHVPQADVIVEEHLLKIHDLVMAKKFARIAIDTLSGFLHKVHDMQLAREKIFQITTVVQNSDAVGLLSSDIPSGIAQLSQFGIEEAIVDGIFVLTFQQEGHKRRRYIEVYKLRNSAHAMGQHPVTITARGIQAGHEDK